MFFTLLLTAAFYPLLQGIDFFRPTEQLFEADFHTPEHITSSPKKFLIDTEGCRIPAMDIYDRSIRRYLLARTENDKEDGFASESDLNYEESPIRCQPPEQHPFLSPLVSSNLTHIFLDFKAITERNLTLPPECCYKPFRRTTLNISVNDTEGEADNQFESGLTCIDFGTSACMDDNEFVEVLCYQAESNKSELIYKDFFSFTPVKNTSVTDDKTDSPTTDIDRLSVLLLGVDSVSRLNLHRQMPKTVDYLKNNLKAVEMFGYNKVDDNTFPNVVPVLTGLTVNELSDICWPTDSYYFDDCPILWKAFSRAGYKTLLAEDASWMSIFNNGKKGFVKQPTDYYWRPFNSRAESEIGSQKRMIAHLCIGYRLTLSTLLDYTKKFALTFAKESFFGFIWGTSLSHDYLNLPRFGDDYHLDLFQTLHEKGALDNCITVFMSDHGIRWGGIRSTYQGHLEERLPFLFLAFPEKFRNKYPTALGYLHTNAHRLTTPFDLHETLKDILHSEQQLNNVSIENRIRLASELMSKNSTNTTDKRQRRGLSLFLPVPTSRTCEDAGIIDHWCACHQSTAISVNDTDVINAANYLIAHANGLVVNEPQCALLSLKQVISARIERMHANEPEKETDGQWLKNYIIIIKATPGDGNFEATVQKITDGTFRIMGAVSRTNYYGNQSACIKNYRLKLYCYCSAVEKISNQNITNTTQNGETDKDENITNTTQGGTNVT